MIRAINGWLSRYTAKQRLIGGLAVIGSASLLTAGGVLYPGQPRPQPLPECARQAEQVLLTGYGNVADGCLTPAVLVILQDLHKGIPANR